jgi:hypothetical protein
VAAGLSVSLDDNGTRRDKLDDDRDYDEECERWRVQVCSVNRAEGIPLQDLMQVPPTLSRNQVQKLLQELRHEGKAHNLGRTRASRWHPGPAPAAIAPKK